MLVIGPTFLLFSWSFSYFENKGCQLKILLNSDDVTIGIWTRGWGRHRPINGPYVDLWNHMHALCIYNHRHYYQSPPGPCALTYPSYVECFQPFTKKIGSTFFGLNHTYLLRNLLAAWLNFCLHLAQINLQPIDSLITTPFIFRLSFPPRYQGRKEAK